MEKLNKLTAPASEKLRQLQKMVEGIKKNDGSIMNRLKRFQNEKAAFIRKTGKSTWNRLKNKPPPKVPTRDYKEDDDVDADEWSGSEFDSDTYEDPLEDQDDSYEPPPSEQDKRVFTPSSSTSFSRGEYVDSLRDTPRKPVRHPRDSKPRLPPKPGQADEDSEDYINPEEGEEDNYIEPSDKPSPSAQSKSGSENPPFVNRGVKPGTTCPVVSNNEPERSNSPDLYEVPDPEDNSPSVSRLQPPAQTLPPRASPRFHVKKLPPAPQSVNDEDDDEYEICDPDESEGVELEESAQSALKVPTPRPRGLNKPCLPVKPKAALPNTEPQDALKHNHRSPQPPPTDSAQARSPLPKRISSPKPPTDRGASPAPRNGPSAAEEEAGVYKKAWYARTCDRRTAEEALIRYKKDGAFLVRKSSGQDPSQPYTLVVLYKGKVYNIPVRHIHHIHQYALGREKKGEERFSSVSHIIENHQKNPLVLIDSQNNTKDSTKLQHAVRP